MQATRNAPIGNERYAMIFAVYASALLQGISLILFPASGSLFQSAEFHALSDGQYGVLFTPQIVGAIVMSLAVPNLAQRFGMKRVLIGGMLLNVLGMLLHAGSALLIGSNVVAFVVLLLGTAAIGGGFGTVITALNAYAFDLFRDKADAAVVALHVLAGTGQAAASLVLDTFLQLGFWWGSSLTIAAAFLLMAGFQSRLALSLSSEEAKPEGGASQIGSLPLRIWLFAIVVYLYGSCEATYGNWARIYLEQSAELSASQSAQGLAIFWGAVTAGRALFALAAVWFKPQPLYLVAPFVVAAAFIALPLVSGAVASIALIGLAGLALSFFFPLTISIASAEESEQAPAVSGAMVGAIQLGVGLSSIIVGQAREGLGLPLIFQLSSGYAILMAALVIYLMLTRPANRAAS